MEEILVKYITDILRNPDTAVLNRKQIGKGYEDLADALEYLHHSIREAMDYSLEIARGNLNTSPPKKTNVMAGPTKEILSNLNHINYLMKQISRGENQVEMNYLGDLSESFNTMVKEFSKRKDLLIQSSKDAQLMIEQITYIQEFMLAGNPPKKCGELLQRICQDKGITYQGQVEDVIFPFDERICCRIMARLCNLAVFFQELDGNTAEPSLNLRIYGEHGWKYLDLEFTYDGILELEQGALNPAPGIALQELDEISAMTEGFRGIFDYEADPETKRMSFEIRVKDRIS